MREVHYPILSICDPEPPMVAITSERVSERIENLPEQIRNCFTHYMAPDQKYIRRMTLYPGRTSSMNCFALDWGEDGLYYGCHDDSFELTGQVFELERWSQVNMFMVRYPFLKPGESRTECNLVVSPYSGNWTVCAEKYRKWANGWFTPPQIPDHVAYSPGWQRIILHHQYGEYLFPYEKLEQAYDDAAQAGIDTLFLFGWTAAGMDSGYPVYSADPKLGGVKTLKENIRKVQAKGGRSSSTSTVSSSTWRVTITARGRGRVWRSNAQTAPNTASPTTSPTAAPFCGLSSTRPSSWPAPPAVPGWKF